MYEISQVDSSGSKPVSYFIEKFSTLPFLVLSVYWAEITKKLKLRSFRFLSMENHYFLSLKKFLLSLSDLHKVNRENYVSFFSFTGLIKLVDTFISVLVLILLLWQFRLLEKTNTTFRFEITKNSITRLKVVSRIEIDLNKSVFFIVQV